MAKRRHHRRNTYGLVNPKTRTVYRSRGGGGRSGGGSTNWGMIALIGGGAYLLLSSGMLGRAFGSTGQTVTPQQLLAAGYQDMGGGYYRNPTTGQTIYRNPQTGQVQPSGGAVPPGTSPWLAPLYQIGQAAIPQIGAGVGAGIASLFNPQTWSNLFSSSPSTVPTDAGGTTTYSDVLRSGDGGLAPLPAIAPGGFDWLSSGGFSLDGGTLPAIEPAPDLWSGGALSTDWLSSFSSGGSVALTSPDLPELGGNWVTSLDLAPIDTSGWFSDPSYF